MKIRIGSRGSDLALWQANFVKDQLVELGHDVDIKIIVTKGDQIQDLSFDKIEGKGFFTKEIEEALLSNEVDLAVHSHKDLETTSPEGLMIAAVSHRADPKDILLIRNEGFSDVMFLDMKQDAIVGTSSARRRTQIRRLRPDVEIKDLRGNVPTRVQKLKDGQYDAIILAAAGISRLNLDLSNLRIVELDPTWFVPAPAQGVLGLQIRETDLDLNEALRAIHHPDVAERIAIERGVLRLMEGGCQLPLGVYCIKEFDEYVVYTSYTDDKEGEAEISSYQTNDKVGLIETIAEDLKNELS